MRAFPTGGAAPDLFVFYLSQTEGSLPDQLAHTEVSNPVPGTDRIAHSALVAVFEVFATLVFYDVYDFLILGYVLHGLS